MHPPREFPDAAAVFPHPGEEFLLVLKGAIEVQVGEREFRLDTGDSLYFDSELPHRCLLYTSKAGVVVRLVGQRIGAVATADGAMLDADASLDNQPSVLFDGAVVPAGGARAMAAPGLNCRLAPPA